MYDSQTRQEYQWITGGCKNIIQSPNIKRFYYSDNCVKFNKCIELGIQELPKKIMKNDKIYMPRFACGSVYVQGLGVGIYDMVVELPMGKHLIPEIKLVNMFDENKNVLQIIKGYTNGRNNYKKLFSRYCNLFSYTRSNIYIDNVYSHTKEDYFDDVDRVHIHIVLTSDCIIMKLNGKVIMAVSMEEAYDTIKSLNTGASLAIVFALSIDSKFVVGNLKSNFKIKSFDFMPLHKINSVINK